MLLVFAAVVGLLLRIIPGPHKDTDYLVIGSVATFASLATLFVTLITTWVKLPNLFFLFRRKR
jgi:hypothetical protein